MQSHCGGLRKASLKWIRQVWHLSALGVKIYIAGAAVVDMWAGD